MANTTFKTRLQLKYDTLANWTTANPVLLAGEVGIVSVPTATETTVGQVTKPAILFKVGDGTAKFSELPWASSLAADVYEWAKKETLEYEALPQTLRDTIDTLQALTAGELKMNDVTYSSLKEYVDAKTAGIATDAALSDLTTRVTTLETNITNYATTESVNATIAEINAAITGLDGRITAIENDYLKASDKVELNQAIQDAVDAIPEYDDEEIRGLIDAKYTKPEAGIGTDDLAENVTASLALADSALQANDITELESKVDTLVGEDANKSVRSISAEEVAKIVAGANESYDTLKEIADWISTHSDSAAAMNSAIVALQAIVAGIGGEDEQTTVVAYVNAAIEALNIGDYAKAAELTTLAGRVDTVEAAIETINNKTTGILAQAKEYADSLANNYIQEVTTTEGDGLTITKDGTSVKIDLDKEAIFVFNCGSATELVD